MKFITISILVIAIFATSCSTFDDSSFEVDPTKEVDPKEEEESEEENNATTITSYDGCQYKIVTIGEQTWFAENLKAETYMDGSTIPYVSDRDEWEDTYMPARCAYDNNDINVSTYGYLYNFFAIHPGYNGGKEICPKGWHIPSIDEWETLRLFVEPGSLGNNSNSAGIPLKENSTLWGSRPGTDIYGFAARPGGDRSGSSGRFDEIGVSGNFWSGTPELPDDLNLEFALSIRFSDKMLFQRPMKNKLGFSCRCIQDQ